jgi:hypothetical protein
MNVITDDITQGPTPMPSAVRRAAMVTTVLGAALLIPAAIVDFQRFSANWLTLFAFIVSLGAGSLLLVALEYTVGAKWSIPFRRISEHMATIVPVSLLLVIPLLLGMSTLYEWTHADVVASDHLIHEKAAYLNTPFWLIRLAVYFVIWIAAYVFFARGSMKQDASGDIGHTKHARIVSPVFIILYALTMTFAAVDWIMSLMPHWFSTMFGVYFGVSGIVAALAATTFIAVQLKLNGMLPEAVRGDHFYSLGGLLFAMNTLWAYIAFAQFLLIWYGNIPIERIWYIPRTEGGWMWLTVIQVIGHFFVPFFALISRESKMNLLRLRWVAVWLLAAHLLDMYWITVPSVQAGRAALSWHELWVPFLAIGIATWTWLWSTKFASLLPVRDPRLQTGLEFHLT